MEEEHQTNPLTVANGFILICSGARQCSVDQLITSDVPSATDQSESLDSFPVDWNLQTGGDPPPHVSTTFSPHSPSPASPRQVVGSWNLRQKSHADEGEAWSSTAPAPTAELAM